MKSFALSLHFILIDIQATNGYLGWSITMLSYTVLIDTEAKTDIENLLRALVCEK